MLVFFMSCYKSILPDTTEVKNLNSELQDQIIEVEKKALIHLRIIGVCITLFTI